MREKPQYNLPWNRNRSQWPGAARWKSRLGRYFRNPLLLILSVLAVLSLFSHHFHLHAPPIFHRYSGFRNCTQMHAAGLYSVPVGHPAYRPWLDADNDGLACEPWHPHSGYR